MASKFSPLQSLVFLIIFAATANALDNQTLDVQTLTGNTYLAMLQRIRSGLARTYSKNVAVLDVFEESPNPPMFDVVLRTSEHQISVKVREDNLYALGYRNQDGLWLEFGYERPGAVHRIPGSRFLEMNDSYLALERASGTNALALPFTRYELINAVDDLAVTANMALRAKRLIQMVYAICEATRFADISTLLARNLNAASSRLETYMAKILVENWKKYSTNVLRTEADPCYKFVPTVVQGGKNDTVDELRNRFGLMYRDPITLCPPCEPVPCNQAAAALNGNIPMVEMWAQA